MKLFRHLLFPFSFLYGMLVYFRNLAYHLGILKSKSYCFPIICVGNLSVGGTGKSPMVMYLVQYLKNRYRVATLSRGYKRTSQGFVLATNSATAQTIGDEPLQFYTAFKDEISVGVDANRQAGIAKLMALNPKPEVILLDDAFQHRKVNAGLNILLTAYQQRYTKDYILPTGNLREPRSGAKRAQLIVVTKCPENLTELEQEQIKTELSPNQNQHIFFSKIVYSNKVYALNNSKKLEDFSSFTLVTGIANAGNLVNYLIEKGCRFKHLNYPDHYNFTENDIAKFSTLNTILTTEKDFMRLQQFAVLKDKLYYIPITISICNASKFNSLIDTFLASKNLA